VRIEPTVIVTHAGAAGHDPPSNGAFKIPNGSGLRSAVTLKVHTAKNGGVFTGAGMQRRFAHVTYYEMHSNVGD
jgi:hypothetical protein